MANYRTNGTYGLGSQVRIVNRNSSVDYDYGAYDSFDDIPAALYDTVQIGKTIGIVTDGKIKEYWWQKKSDGTLGWVVKGVDNDTLNALIAAAMEKGDAKEVIGVVGYGDTVPDANNLDEGDYFLYTDNENGHELLFVEVKNEQTGVKGWTSVTPSIEVIYKTITAESKLFVWDGEEFVDVTGEAVDDTIYVNDLNILLTKSLPQGVYQVVLGQIGYGGTIINSIGNNKLQLIKWVRYTAHLTDSLIAAKNMVEAIPNTPLDLSEYDYVPTDTDFAFFNQYGILYTTGDATVKGSSYVLSVTANGRILENKDGWAEPKADNTAWEWNNYAYNGHTHEIGDIYDNNGDDLAIADESDEDAELVFPIESETLQAIARGEYESEDTAMFSGTTSYVPMTSAQVSALVETVMTAFNAARETNE